MIDSWFDTCEPGSDLWILLEILSDLDAGEPIEHVAFNSGISIEDLDEILIELEDHPASQMVRELLPEALGLDEM